MDSTNAKAVLGMIKPEEYYQANPHKALDDLEKVRLALETSSARLATRRDVDDVLDAAYVAAREKYQYQPDGDLSTEQRVAAVYAFLAGAKFAAELGSDETVRG